LDESGVPPVQPVTTIASTSSPSCRLMNGWTTAIGLPVPQAAFVRFRRGRAGVTG
jgi:hypothetical protein